MSTTDQTDYIDGTSGKRYDAHVALVLEGSYPYIAGGVSSWVHQLLCACPQRRFALLHIGPHEGAYQKRLYELPPNVSVLREMHCRGGDEHAPRRRRRPSTGPLRLGPTKKPSRMLAAFRRLHLTDTVDDELIADLASGDLSVAEFLHGDATFDLLRRELYEQLSPGAPFMDFFWHFRSMHVPLLRLLAAPIPDVALYHAVATGYAGVVGAVASYRAGRPLVVTEHGIYAREREMELSRAGWIQATGGSTQGASPLRRLWTHYFRMLSRIAYHRAARVLTLSESNRVKQVADGADPAKIRVVPNGVDATPPPEPKPALAPKGDRMRVGFVGRVVPIKDVITLIRACALARERVDLEVWVVGPENEDAAYAKRCRGLVQMLGLDDHIKFLGPQKVSEIYPQLDVVLLTSLSEGQPLVILEAYAAGVPVVATDVGACRELVEGRDEEDRELGPSGIVTRVANPPETAMALVKLAQDPSLRAAMGRAGMARVSARYQLCQVVASYETLYTSMVSA